MKLISLIHPSIRPSFQTDGPLFQTKISMPTVKTTAAFTLTGKGSISSLAIIENPPSQLHTHSLTHARTHACSHSLTHPLTYTKHLLIKYKWTSSDIKFCKDWSISLTTFCYEKNFNMQQKLNLSSTFNRMKKSIKVERKRTSNPATDKNYTIIY